jgi:hypothetical protein
VAAGGEPGREEMDDAPGSPSSSMRKNRTMGINPLLISSCPLPRDDNSDTSTRYSSGRPDGYGDDFLSVGGIRTRSESRRV